MHKCVQTRRCATIYDGGRYYQLREITKVVNDKKLVVGNQLCDSMPRVNQAIWLKNNSENEGANYEQTVPNVE